MNRSQQFNDVVHSALASVELKKEFGPYAKALESFLVFGK